MECNYFTCAPISSTALSMAACKPSGFLPPAVAKTRTAYNGFFHIGMPLADSMGEGPAR